MGIDRRRCNGRPGSPPSARGVWAALLGLALVAASCGDSDSGQTFDAQPPDDSQGATADPEITPAGADAPTSDPEPSASDAPAPPREEDTLKKKDTPPGGVDEQFDTFGTPGPPICHLRMNPSVINEATIEVGTVVGICTDGEFVASNIDVQIVASDGGIVGRGVISSGGGGFFPALIPILPGTAPAAYDVLADQSAAGGPTATGALTVTPATRPQGVVSPQAGAPGTTFRIGYAGLAPNQEFSAFLYESGGPAPGDLVGVRWLYLTELSLTTNGDGLALFELESEADDAPGTYRLVTPVAGALVFDLG